MVDIGLNAFVLVFWAQMSSEPCVGFPRISSGKPILTSESQFLRRISSDFFLLFFSFVYVFFCHFMEFSKKGLGFLFVFVVFLFVGVRVVTILFFSFFLVLHL